MESTSSAPGVRPSSCLRVPRASSPRRPPEATPLTVLFRPGAGTFVASETVTLSVQAKADIHFTLDGSLPTAVSPVYQGPLTLEESTRLRAVAIARGAPTRGGSGDATADVTLQGPVATEIYLRVNPDTQGFTEPPADHPDSHLRVGNLGCVRDRPRSGGHPGVGTDVRGETAWSAARRSMPASAFTSAARARAGSRRTVRARAARRRETRTATGQCSGCPATPTGCCPTPSPTIDR